MELPSFLMVFSIIFQSFQRMFHGFSHDFPRPFRCYGRRQGAELSGGAGQNHLGAGHADAVALGRQHLAEISPGICWDKTWIC